MAQRKGSSTAGLAEMKVDELRSQAREKGISGVWSMRKDELVQALSSGRNTRKATMGGGRQTADNRRAGGVRTGKGSSRSVRYAQEVSSPEEEPERPGRSLVTTDHDVIRSWAQDRCAEPATVTGTEHEDHLGVLRLDFPGGARATGGRRGKGGGKLRRVSWDEWFETFDARGLNFIYQEQTSDGSTSNFFRLENPTREDA